MKKKVDVSFSKLSNQIYVSTNYRRLPYTAALGKAKWEISIIFFQLCLRNLSNLLRAQISAHNNLFFLTKSARKCCLLLCGEDEQKFSYASLSSDDFNILSTPFHFQTSFANRRAVPARMTHQKVVTQLKLLNQKKKRVIVNQQTIELKFLVNSARAWLTWRNRVNSFI